MNVATPSVNPGNNGLPMLQLRSADGAQATLYLDGAHLVSWIPAGDPAAPAQRNEQLYLSPNAEFRSGTAIRGGIPVIFPQFAAEGPLLKHGFARLRRWQLIEHSGPHARLQLRDDAETRALWPHAFAADLSVTVTARTLQTTLHVTNLGDTALHFTAALHTYLRVDDLDAVRLRGLKGLRYRDSAAGNAEHRQSDETLAIVGEVDRIYFNAPARLQLSDAGGTRLVEQHGFTDTVVWNPGAVRAAALADLPHNGWREFVCVEAAAVSPVQLQPGAHWSGSQIWTV